MSRMKDRYFREVIDPQERFKQEVERDTYKGQLALECMEQLVGYYTGIRFTESDDQRQWLEQSRY
jgi:hypothetical protein